MAEQASIVAELIVDAAVRAAIISNDRAELTTLLETRSSDGGLYLAADLNRADCIAALLPYTTGSAIDKPAKYSTTPLHVASSKGHAECVQLLLAAKAAIDQPTSDGRTPLLAACYYGRTACVRLLLGAHASVDRPNKREARPLFSASNNGHTECVRLLLGASASVNLPACDGLTNLHAASNGGNSNGTVLVGDLARKSTPCVWAENTRRLVCGL